MEPGYRVDEVDSCAIIALVNKQGESNHANIVQTIDGLRKMGHRSGDIHGEGDGCGLAIDIPRALWAGRLAAEGENPHLTESSGFFVGHFLIAASRKKETRTITAAVKRKFEAETIHLLGEIAGNTRDEELGSRARAEAPFFWQLVGLLPDRGPQDGLSRLFRLRLELEKMFGSALQVASLSQHSAIYKLQGQPDQLPRVYPELLDPEASSAITLGHGRYSTNTLPTVFRSQPFSVLGHNGEINTIERLRSAARALGIPPVPGGSDSQDLNRLIEGLISVYGLELTEALEMVFPAIHSEVDQYPPELRKLYAFYRWFFSSSAQGPAGIVARAGDICMGCVDALGLRPLWFGESDTDYFLSSEKGVVDLKRTLSDPRPLAPGEKLAILGGRSRPARVLEYGALQERLLELLKARFGGTAEFPAPSPPSACRPAGRIDFPEFPVISGRTPNLLEDLNLLAAFGWQHYDLMIRQKVALGGREVIGSMGHTGPLAALAPEALFNTADYFKENVAVVTNPAIDREREAEHFSTRTMLGRRPKLGALGRPQALELGNPLLLEAVSLQEEAGLPDLRELARKYRTCLFEDVISFFRAEGGTGAVCRLAAVFDPDRHRVQNRLGELCQEAAAAIGQGAALLVLDDTGCFHNGQAFIDPGLAVAALHEFLLEKGLRRRVGIVVRSAAIRNLHDVMFLLGLGAEALVPSLLWRVALASRDEEHSAGLVLANTMGVLQKGMEKVMSTMGIHELCGYGRIFSAVGLRTELGRIFQVPDFCRSDATGLGFEDLNRLSRLRLDRAHLAEQQELFREPLRNPRVGKVLRKLALGRIEAPELAAELEAVDRELPVGVRHLLDFQTVPKDEQVPLDQTDISVGRHALPLVIAAMSFGSQGENSFRIYAEAAKKANIVCLNGEGGEIPDMLGRYRHHRGQQIASGRFGVFMGLLNSADILEIKIGQGAKPGEGGHLPGTKVTEMVAQARHCKPGITLISPSNHHDIYSIEDLAQIITELKTANPKARVSVKIPITSGVGTIAVGIAKAGADILNLSGYEGGTGAAREHAKRFVGLPAEIGVSEAHRALVESGLRDSVEIWTDGGMRSGADVLKMILLGANRVGFGTAALMGIGCISCQRCHLDRCPRGISTQVQSKEDAETKGVKGFSPRVVTSEAENLARMFTGIGEELRLRLAALGERRLQDLVGRTDLLTQVLHRDRLDVSTLFMRPAIACTDDCLRPRIVRKPLNYLTKLISDLVMARFEQGRTEVHYADDGVQSTDRAVGTYLAGAMIRRFEDDIYRRVLLDLESSVPGNGLCSFSIPGFHAFVEGGSQDGAAKGSFGGRLAVLKGKNLFGRRVDGSTGKSFGYGAVGGLLMLQNMADSRACIRLSGADAVFGARITAPIRDEKGNIATRAHLKGFAFEYMTGGRVVVLGDPGPWICAGMTGGVIYQCLYPEHGFDQNALARRLARGAMVALSPIEERGLADIRDLLPVYIRELEKSFQHEEAQGVSELLQEAAQRFIMIIPSPQRTLPAE